MTPRVRLLPPASSAGVLVALLFRRAYETETTDIVGENVAVTKHGIQTVTSNRNASDLSACRWLRAPDLNQRCRRTLAAGQGIRSRVSIP